MIVDAVEELFLRTCIAGIAFSTTGLDWRFILLHVKEPIASPQTDCNQIPPSVWYVSFTK